MIIKNENYILKDNGKEERIDHELDDDDDGAVWIFFSSYLLS